MPRVNHHYLPGHVWHITHCCHKHEVHPRPEGRRGTPHVLSCVWHRTDASQASAYRNGVEAHTHDSVDGLRRDIRK